MTVGCAAGEGKSVFLIDDNDELWSAILHVEGPRRSASGSGPCAFYITSEFVFPTPIGEQPRAILLPLEGGRYPGHTSFLLVVRAHDLVPRALKPQWVKVFSRFQSGGDVSRLGGAP